MAEPAGTTTRLANPPRPTEARTRSPRANLVTPGPIDTTCPATSLPRYEGEIGLDLVLPGHEEAIHKVDTRRLDRDGDLARSRFGIRPVLHPQDGGRTEEPGRRQLARVETRYRRRVAPPHPQPHNHHTIHSTPHPSTPTKHTPPPHNPPPTPPPPPTPTPLPHPSLPTHPPPPPPPSPHPNHPGFPPSPPPLTLPLPTTPPSHPPPPHPHSHLPLPHYITRAQLSLRANSRSSRSSSTPPGPARTSGVPPPPPPPPPPPRAAR